MLCPKGVEDMLVGDGGSIGLAIISAVIAAVRRLIRNGTVASRLDDPEVRVQLRSYLNQLSFVATLSARRLVSDELLRDLFYQPATACWERCAKRAAASSPRSGDAAGQARVAGLP